MNDKFNSYIIVIIGILAKMLEQIQAYWNKLKTNYENIYGNSLLGDFDKSKEYLEEMKSYLLAKQEEHPSDVNVGNVVLDMIIFDRGMYVK